MNILIANWSWYPTGGDWTAIENLVSVYERKGHNVIPFSMHHERNYPTPYSRYFVSNIDYVQLNRKRSLFNGVRVATHAIYSCEAKSNLERLLSENRIDVAHLHNLGPQITPSIVAPLKRLGIPVVLTLHDFVMLCPATSFVSNGRICEECLGGRFYRCTVNRCKKGSYVASFMATLAAYGRELLKFEEHIDAFICPSKFLHRKFIEAGFDQEKLVHLNYAYEPTNFLRTDSVSPEKGHPYILFTGRLERIKGIYTLIEAFRHVEGVKLLIAGTGAEEPACRALVRERGLKDVVFLGHVTRIEVSRLVNDCLFTVCPSEWYENLPFSVIEAMMLGKPVVGARIGGIPELVVDGVTGLTFESGNVQDLADKMNLLLAHPERLPELGAAARAHVSAMVDPEMHYRKLLAVFNKLGVA